MNITFEKTGNVTGVLTLNIEKADYEANVKKGLQTAQKKVQMPGFRPGHVPAGMVKKMYGTQIKAEEVQKLISEKLYAYIQENNLDVLGEPIAHDDQVDIEKDDNFVLHFDLGLSPEMNVELSSNDTVDYYDINVTEEMVDAQVKRMAQQAGHPENVQTYEERDILRGILAQLDENGQPVEGGIVVESASLMPTYFKNDEQKALFNGAKVNDILVINPSKAYEGNEAEVSSLLKVKKEEVAQYTGDFSFQVNEISRFVPAEINQEFFNAVFGEGAVEGEEAFRAKVKEGIQAQHVLDSDYKFLLDLRAYCEAKVGEVEFPNEVLKKVMLNNNKEKGEAYVEEHFEASINELKWHLIKEKLVKANDIKLEQADVKAAAVEAARMQFAQYGMNNVPVEYLENYAEEMLKNKQQAQSLIERSIETKLVAALKNVLNLNHKAVSAEEFGKLFEN
ncbi:MAG: trigger factor [Bacteroidaceae bacterium]|jgi:trigger factor|nr:trigger factor [Bacteroidaceae bacterium]